ncbi:uncharacterized protein KY384_004417 [Bacidia gigantensis]|uniref:uncharacterized protein n=1 Tax=Bacidia gigantensis TaxID=2732470 RepID=UPI001D051BC3|nr:uncharacterized protein KY384_004417 [Bacidia gigantensis]KAG8531060.1 hypothetical protein KY384_004417 [Bacidia gigantensis]
MPNVLIVGSTRGLGQGLLKAYLSRPSTHIFGTTRSASSSEAADNVTYVTGVDVAKENAGDEIVSKIKSRGETLDIVIVSAGYFGLESFDSPDWAKQVQMYTTSSIGPVFIVQKLVKADLLKPGSKIILVSSESGSITLRHESEGGGNYGHHASKAALNMVGKLLSLDVKDKNIAVGIVHPSFMRTEMTKGVGFDKYWDAGGDIAVTPDEAADSLVKFIDTFDMSKTGQYWAPRGPSDIGTAEPVLGKDLPTPLQLPW